MSGIEDDPTLPDGDVPQQGPGDVPRVLGGRYVLEERLGIGGGATVWRAFDQVLARTVAVKVLRPGVTPPGGAAARLRSEAAAAGRAAHTGIVAVYDTGVEGELAWLAMEHVDGPTLLEVLRHHPNGLPPQAAAAIAEQAAVALAHAHGRGLVHRDVKPANLLLTPDGVVKLADFGVAVAHDEVWPERAGSRGYAAPEQLRGGPGADDPPVDVFALGVVLHECLTGRPAFARDGAGDVLAPRQVRPDVPRDLDAVVRRATRADPAARYPDGASMATALRPLVASDPFELTAGLLAQVAARTAPKPRAGPPEPGEDQRRIDWRLAVLGLLLVAAVGLLAAAAQWGGDAPDEAPTPVADAGVPITRVELFDPYGSVGPGDTMPAAAVDGASSTVWRTPSYPVPLRSLGSPGLGLWVDVAMPRALEVVEVDLPTGGITLELLSADRAPTGSTTEADWTARDRIVRPGSTASLRADGPPARYWLLWITELEPVGETWQAGIQDIRFRPAGTP